MILKLNETFPQHCIARFMWCSEHLVGRKHLHLMTVCKMLYIKRAWCEVCNGNNRHKAYTNTGQLAVYCVTIHSLL